MASVSKGRSACPPPCGPCLVREGAPAAPPDEGAPAQVFWQFVNPSVATVAALVFVITVGCRMFDGTLPARLSVVAFETDWILLRSPLASATATWAAAWASSLMDL